jgi:hypothetical protein
MRNQDELAAQQSEDAAMHCLRTALGFESKPFHMIRLEVEKAPNRNGVMIGVNFENCPPDIREEILALAHKIDVLMYSA